LHSLIDGRLNTYFDYNMGCRKTAMPEMVSLNIIEQKMTTEKKTRGTE